MTDPDLEAARRQIFAIMKETGLEASNLAEAAGLSHSTLTRPLYDPEWKYVPSTRTMNKIMNVATRMRLTPATPLPPVPPRKPRKKRRTKPRLVATLPKKGRL